MSVTYNIKMTAYAAAVEGGYTGTYEEFCQQQATYAGNVTIVTEKAAQVAEDAAQVAENTATVTELASQVAENAETVAENTTTTVEAATEARTAASSASASADNAGRSEAAAANSATASATSASVAAGYASNAESSATAASGSATAAATSETNAAASAEAAAGSLDDVTAAQQAAIAAIQAKGEETRASIPSDYTALSDDVTNLKSDISNVYNRITEGTFTPLLEVGNITYANNVIGFSNYKYRVRTRQGTYYALKAGDVIGLSTYENARFNAYYSTDNGTTWYSSGWRSSDYRVPVDAVFAIMLAKVTEDTSEILQNPESIGFTVYIVDNHSVYSDIQNMDGRINVLNSILTNEGTTVNNFILKGGRLYNYYGQMLTGGTLTVTSIPDRTRIAINGYSDPEYRVKVEDSGWITTVPREISVNPDLYYLAFIANDDYSAITDPSISDDFVMILSYSLNGKVSALEKETYTKFESYMKLQSATVKSIAHRGDYVTAPQCTKPAYILACKNGFRYAENDVNLSSDNHFVMWHDTTLERLGELVDISGYEIYTDGSTFYYYDVANEKLYTYTTEYVESSVAVSGLTRCNGADYSTTTLTLDILKRIDFGVYKGNAYKGTTILTFSEWILLCKQLGMEAYVDTKISYTVERVAALCADVKRLGMLNKVTWININTTTVADYIRTVDSNARIGILAHPTEELINTFTSYNTGRGFFFDGNAKTMMQNDVALGLNAGFEVEAYYVDYEGQTEGRTLERIAEFVDMGVTGLTLDAYRVEDAFAYML